MTPFEAGLLAGALFGLTVGGCLAGIVFGGRT